MRRILFHFKYSIGIVVFHVLTNEIGKIACTP